MTIRVIREQIVRLGVGALVLLGPAQLVRAEGSATVLSGELDFALIYVGSLARPEANAINQGEYSMHQPEDKRRERGLGLRYAKAGLTFESFQSSKFYALIRPEATIVRSDDGDVPREVDTRAGDTYRKLPDIRLLDAYQMTVRPGTGMSLGFGVWEQLSEPAQAYQQILQPGLDVLLAAKFSGLRLRWSRFEPADPANVEKRQKGLITDFYIIQGDRDRVESNIGKNDTDDHAPGAEDPHYGGAISLSWMPADAWSILVTGGSLTSGDKTGKANDVFVELNGILRLAGVLEGLTTSVLIKQSKESFREMLAPVDDRLNQSASLQVLLGLVPGISALSGVSYGKGEWPADELRPFDNTEFTGYQFEFGLQNNPGKDLLLQGILAQEKRSRRTTGESSEGAFFDGENRKNLIRRLAIQISYQLSGLR